MEKYEVKIFPTAKQDLLEIIDYLNTLSPETALRYYDKLTEEIGGLSHMPERCPRPRDLALAAKGYRYLIVENMGGGTIKTFCEDEWPGTQMRSRPLVIPR